MHAKSQPEEQIRLSIVTAPLCMNLLALSSSILHVYCPNPRKSESQAVGYIARVNFGGSRSQTVVVLIPTAYM